MKDTKLMTLRKQRAIEFFQWLKLKDIIVEIGSGIYIIANDERAMLLYDPQEENLPTGFEFGSVFFICDMGGQLEVNICEGQDEFKDFTDN